MDVTVSFSFFSPTLKASKCLLVKHIDLYRFCSVVANVITCFRVCVCCFFLRHSFCLWNLGKPSFNFLHISHVNVTWGIAFVPILFGNWRRHRKNSIWIYSLSKSEMFRKLKPFDTHTNIHRHSLYSAVSVHYSILYFKSFATRLSFIYISYWLSSIDVLTRPKSKVVIHDLCKMHFERRKKNKVIWHKVK